MEYERRTIRASGDNDKEAGKRNAAMSGRTKDEREVMKGKRKIEESYKERSKEERREARKREEMNATWKANHESKKEG